MRRFGSGIATIPYVSMSSAAAIGPSWRTRPRVFSTSFRELAADGPVILLTATKDIDHSSAAVLRDVLAGE